MGGRIIERRDSSILRAGHRVEFPRPAWPEKDRRNDFEMALNFDEQEEILQTPAQGPSTLQFPRQHRVDSRRKIVMVARP